MPCVVVEAATVGRVAAGEVVERPSSVVKELIENSLDAGATSITVEIRGGGIDYLRVTDNGCGIEPGQVRLAFENHATSKLQRAEQLDDIRTLGFRGEALPSIAAVSRVEMTTRARGQEAGTKLSMEGGQNLRVQEAGCPQGTTLVMRDLFFNVPVRRAFLKKPGYEAGLVSDAVARMLLGNPGVSMRFVNGGNTLFHSFGDGKLRHAVFAVYGRETAEGMVELDASEGGARIHGLIGVGELAKASRAHQLFYINGRSVRCPLLSKALEQVSRSRVTIGMYPMCVLNLVIPPTGVDVNVHPNKLEVRFRDEEMMRAACERLLERAFEGERVLQIEKLTAEQPRVERRAEVRALERVEPEKRDEGGAKSSPAPRKAADPGKDFKPQMPPLPTPAAAEQLRLELRTGQGATALREDRFAPQTGPLKTIEVAPVVAGERRPPAQTLPASGTREAIQGMPAAAGSGAAAEPQKGEEGSAGRAALPQSAGAQGADEMAKDVAVSAARMGNATTTGVGASAARTGNASATGVGAPEMQPDATRRELPPYRVIGVAFKTYILVESGDTLMLIDQHAAHERLQYERYMARAREGAASQQLLTPLVLHLSAREMVAVTENLSLLAEAGYAVEPFGDSDVRVTAVPFVMGRAELRPLFLATAQSLTQLKSAPLDARRGAIMQMACKSAGKGGDALSESEIAALISAMLETGAPPTCPHGRPVVKTLTRRELEKMFKRIQ